MYAILFCALACLSYSLQYFTSPFFFNKVWLIRSSTRQQRFQDKRKWSSLLRIVRVSWSVPWPDFTAPFFLTRSLGSSPTGQQRFQNEKRGGFITMNVKVPWTVPWPDYSPPDFTAPFVLNAAWAAPPLDIIDFRMISEGRS
jgi:hypothetical protein